MFSNYSYGKVSQGPEKAQILKHLLKFPPEPTMFEPRFFAFGLRFNEEQVVVEPRTAG